MASVIRCTSGMLIIDAYMCTIACGLLGGCAGSGLSKTSVYVSKQYYIFYFNYGRGSQIPPFILHLKETSPITLILVIGSSNFARET